MNLIDTNAMESPILASINEVQQQHETVIIDLESEFSSISPTIFATNHISNKSTRIEDRAIHSFSLGSSSVTQEDHRRITEYLPQWGKEPEAYYRTMVFNLLGELQESRQC